MDLRSVVYEGEEYDVVHVCPMTGYAKHYLETATEKEKEEYGELVGRIMAAMLYGRMVECGALTRKENVNENGDTFIELEALVLVKRQASAGSVPEDPEQYPPRACDT